MHVIAGIVLMIAVFVLARWVNEAFPYFGLVNPAAMVLLALGPIAVALISHPFVEWKTHVSVIFRAFAHDKRQSLRRASEEMTQIARSVRETRWQEAENAVSRASSEQVQLLAPHVLARLEPEALREAVGSSAFRWMTEVKGADEFLQGLARLGPAFGMIGTIMGLVDLFANMRDSASLGPGMAMALLATLYGLILCYCVYMPLAQRVRSYLASGVGEQRLIERALRMILEGRPVNEVRNAFSENTINVVPQGQVPEPESTLR